MKPSSVCIDVSLCIRLVTAGEFSENAVKLLDFWFAQQVQFLLCGFDSSFHGPSSGQLDEYSDTLELRLVTL